MSTGDEYRPDRGSGVAQPSGGRSWNRACDPRWIPGYETAYLQVEQKLLGADALESLGWTGLLNSKLLERMWPHVKPMVSPVFATYLEAEQPRLQSFAARDRSGVVAIH